MQKPGLPIYLAPLNPEQQRAVLHTGNPLLILAGAGSGKTRVITTKIAWLIREQGMDPRSILAVTFTNKAAREMAERARVIEPMAGDAMLRTFHSFGAWFLRRNGAKHDIPLQANFVIYNDDDVVSLLSSIMENVPKPEIKHIAHSISRAKDYFLSPNDPMLAKIDSRKKFRDAYACYEERMAQIGNVDFGDLIKKPVEILRSQPEVAGRFHDRFKVILVDEYQDANVAQFHLLKELCGPKTYVCVVGDDDQSIYRFRGAEVKNILEFPDKFSGADIIRLESNYRSTSHILKAASSVVDFNRGRLGKTLRAEKGSGSLPFLVYLQDQNEETDFCAGKIKASVKKGAAYSDWAILYRTNAQSLGFETKFLQEGIPYRIVGSLKFYDREEIKDALSLLALIVNPRDEVAFRRIVNKPTRGIGAVSVDKIVEAAAGSNGNLLDTGKGPELSQKARKGLDEFIKVMEDGKKLMEQGAESRRQDAVVGNPDITQQRKISYKNPVTLVPGKGLSIFITQLVNDSGLTKYHQEQDEIAGNSKVGNLQELVNAADDYTLNHEGLLKFLQDIELDRELSAKSKDDLQDTVTLITFHNTKGLEFKRVIMTGLEQGIFPREEKKDEELEEERRLFYVGATRAMDELYLTSCDERRMYGRTIQTLPSLFLREIDKNTLQTDDRRKRTPLNTFVTYSNQFNNFQPPKRVSNVPAYANTLANVSKDADLEKRAGYKRGDRILHDHHGFGGVVKLKDSDEGPIVYVRFDSGKEVFFNSEKYGRAFEKIGDD